MPFIKTSTVESLIYKVLNMDLYIFHKSSTFYRPQKNNNANCDHVKKVKDLIYIFGHNFSLQKIKLKLKSNLTCNYTILHHNGVKMESMLKIGRFA